MLTDGINKCTTTAELATLWCFRLTARRFRCPRDAPEDMKPEFDNLVELGFSIEFLNAELLKPRDRSEYMWQFRKRLMEGRKGTGQGMSALERKLREGINHNA